MHQTIEELKLGTYDNIATVCILFCLVFHFAIFAFSCFIGICFHRVSYG